MEYVEYFYVIGNYVSYPVIFLTTFTETIFGFGALVPGTATVMLGATYAASGRLLLAYVLFLGIVGFSLGHIVSYWIGRVGWYRLLIKLGMREKLRSAERLWESERHVVWVGYSITGIGSFLSTTAGVMRYPFRSFLKHMLPAQAIATTGWVLLAYSFGIYFANALSAFVAVLLLAVMIGFFVNRYMKKKEKR